MNNLNDPIEGTIELPAKRYCVGGFVRDSMINVIHGTFLLSKDFDFVVTGVDVEYMENRGFKRVGDHFPVFLHPTTNDEYALARTEVKDSVGHKGFSVETEGVTLKEDLGRRDLRINSMAIGLDGVVIDPYNGMDDIKNCKLSAVNPKAFKEDPLRIFRLARIAAQLTSATGKDWTVEEKTLKACRRMSSNELDALSKDRIWKEIEKALKSGDFFKFTDTLNELGWLYYVFPFLAQSRFVSEDDRWHPEPTVYDHIKLVVRQAEDNNGTPEEIFACLTHDIAKPDCYMKKNNGFGHEESGFWMLDKLQDTVGVIPKRFMKLAKTVARNHTLVHSCLGRGGNNSLTSRRLYKLLGHIGGLEKLENLQFFRSVVRCCEFDSRGRGGDYPDLDYPQANFLIACSDLFRSSYYRSERGTLLASLEERGLKGVEVGNALTALAVKVINEEKELW